MECPSYSALPIRREATLPSRWETAQKIRKKAQFIFLIALCDYATSFTESLLLSKEGINTLAAVALIFKINIVVDSLKGLVQQNATLIAETFGRCQPMSGEEQQLLSAPITTTASWETIGNIARQGWILSCTIGVLSFVPLYFFTEKMIHATGADKNISSAVADYYKPVAWSIPFMLGNEINERLLTSVDQEVWLLPYSIIGAAIGLCLNFTLIPLKGTHGAGLSVMTQEISCFIISTIFIRFYRPLRIIDIFNKSLKGKHLRKTLKQGLPIFFNIFIAGAATTTISFFLERIGKVYLALDQAIAQWLGLIYILYHAVCEGANRLIAQSAGAKRFTHSVRYGNVSLCSAIIIYTVFALIMCAISPTLIHVFFKNENTPIDHQFIKKAFMLKSFVDFSYMIYDASSQNLYGLQDTLSAAVYFIIPILCFIVPLSAHTTLVNHHNTINISHSNSTTKEDHQLFKVYTYYIMGISVTALLTTYYWKKQSQKVVRPNFNPTEASSNARYTPPCCRNRKNDLDENPQPNGTQISHF